MRKINCTKEICAEVALRFKSKTDFHKYSSTIYYKSKKNGWFDEITSHMIRAKQYNFKWNKENCINEALKYNTKKEFIKKSIGAYNASYRNGWIDEICQHMDIVGNKTKRCIYAAEFNTNHVYIGLTFNFNKRKSDHLKIDSKHHHRTSLTKHIIKTNQIPNFIQLTDYIDIDLASKMEGDYVEKYRLDGWNVINERKTGGLGCANIIWNKEICWAITLKYKTLKDFIKHDDRAYQASKKHGWFDEITTHLIRIPITTKNECYVESLKYDNKTDFRNKSRRLYNVAYKKGWLTELCKDMVKNDTWNIEKCKQLALECKTIGEFMKKHLSAYSTITHNNWYDYVFEHIPPSIFSRRHIK